MGFRFVGQPFPDAEQIGKVVGAALRDAANDHAWFVTAWGKQSGLSRIAQDLEDFRAKGGHVEAIVGVDEGGATIEGLRLTIKLCDTPLVFHDPGQRTFHPKIYVVQNDEQAVAVVGSGNLTRGGLYTNYEGAVVAELDLSNSDEAAFLESVRGYYERLTGLDVCKPLTDDDIEDIKADPSVVVESETNANKKRQKRRGKGRSKMFGGSGVPGLLDAPPPGIKPLPDEDEDDDSALVPEQSGKDVATPPSQAQPVLRWWKKLTVSDAHRKPAPSHQRNYVILNQAGHNIAWDTWFREELFGDLPWSAQSMHTGNTKEVTVVPFEVFVEGTHVGHYDLRVDHSAGRIARQGNTPTYLNWSGMLGLIKAEDYTDWWLELARLDDDTYRLRLLRDEPS